MRTLAIRAVEIAGGGRRLRVAGGPAVADIDPEAALPGAATAGVEHRHRRVVAVQPVAGEDMGAERVDERRHQRRGAADPVGHGRAGDLHALAGVDVGLAIERKMVAVLGAEHVGDEAGPGLAALDRQARRRRLHRGVAVAAGVAGPDVADDAERRRHVLQHLGDVLAALAERAAAAIRADRRRLVAHLLARQMRWRELPGRAFGRDGRGNGRGRGRTRCRLGQGRLAVLEREFQLGDRPVELLRRGAEPGPLQRGELGLQPVDQRVARAQRGGLRPDDRLQGGGVGRQRVEPDVHGPESTCPRSLETALSHGISGIVRQRGPAARSRTAAASRSPPRAWRAAPRSAAPPRPPAKAREIGPSRAPCSRGRTPGRPR